MLRYTVEVEFMERELMATCTRAVNVCVGGTTTERSAWPDGGAFPADVPAAAREYARSRTESLDALNVARTLDDEVERRRARAIRAVRGGRQQRPQPQRRRRRRQRRWRAPKPESGAVRHAQRRHDNARKRWTQRGSGPRRQRASPRRTRRTRHAQQRTPLAEIVWRRPPSNLILIYTSSSHQ